MDPTPPSLMPVLIHETQFPQNIRRDLRQSLAARRVNHKFHYDSVKQTAKWLALHEAVSPARRDPDCTRIYDEAAAWVAGKYSAPGAVLTSIGCGGGQKDVQILRQLRASGRPLVYLPVDVSPAMAMVAAQAAWAVMGRRDCRPVALDFANTDDLPGVIATVGGDVAPRLLACFGMLPNFEPQLIFPRLAAALRPGEHLVLSANLSPGKDYQAGTQRVLPQYDNPPTRDWLMTFLLDLGFELGDGELVIRVEPCPDHADLLRIGAHFEVERERVVRVDEEDFYFRRGESIRLFFSYRYTPERVRDRLAACGMEVVASWITASQEEGVFVCRRI